MSEVSLSPILTPGLYENISHDAYHLDPCPLPSLSSGIGKTLLTKSPWHAHQEHPRLNPARKLKTRKDFDLGSAVHAVILSDKRDFTHIQFDDYKKGDAKKARDAAYAAGNIPVLTSQWDAANAMRDQFFPQLAQFQDGELLEVWDGAKSEQTVIWEDQPGAWCRVRCDRLSVDRKIIFDVKSTKLAAPESATRLAINSYDVQNGLYRRGCNKMLSPDVWDYRFIFLFQEVVEPYGLCAVEYTPQATAYADDRARKAIDRWGDCLASGEWSGYPKQIVAADLPPWKAYQWEYEKSAEGEE